MARKLYKETCRLDTFRSWNLPFIDPQELARYGFYYTGTGSRVKCNFCLIENDVWEQGDDVFMLHLLRSSKCPLFMKRPTNNVPIDDDFLDDIPDLGEDAIASIVDSAQTDDEDNFAVITLENLTTVQSASAYPKYAAEADRLSSFEHWPTSIHQKPQQLSDAGFFYTGSGDRVVCFSCGGGLKEWQKDDEPWEQHAFWHSNCMHLTRKKGLKFIEKCEKMYMDGDCVHSQPCTFGFELAASSSTRTPFTPPSFTLTATSEQTSSYFADDESTPPPTPTAPTEEDLGCNQSIAESKICKVCYINEYNTAFLPCGHLVTCAECASLVDKCPLCQQPFTSLQRIYLG